MIDRVLLESMTFEIASWLRDRYQMKPIWDGIGRCFTGLYVDLLEPDSDLDGLSPLTPFDFWGCDRQLIVDPYSKQLRWRYRIWLPSAWFDWRGNLVKG